MQEAQEVHAAPHAAQDAAPEPKRRGSPLGARTNLSRACLLSRLHVRLARRYQGYGGTRFVEDDLAGDPEAGALASNGQGAGLAAAQAFRSQLPQDAAEYVRLNVLPRPPQIIGRQRLLDKAGRWSVAQHRL